MIQVTLILFQISIICSVLGTAVMQMYPCVAQKGFRVYELTEHGARVLAFICFCFVLFFFPMKLANLITDLAVKSTYGDCC